MSGKPRRTARTNRARETFIATLAQSCNVSEAARSAGIGRTTAYEWRTDDAEFAAAWDAAEQEAADKLEREAWRRGHDGYDEPVFHAGKKVGTIKRYSDRMLEILLKGHRPEKFVDRIKAEHSGSVPVTFNFIRQDEAPHGD